MLEQIYMLQELARNMFNNAELEQLGEELIRNCLGLTTEDLSNILENMTPVIKIVQEKVKIETEVKPQQEANLKAWYNNIPKTIGEKATSFKNFVLRKNKKEDKNDKNEEGKKGKKGKKDKKDK